MNHEPANGRLTTVTGVVLAGGGSTRMGTDKAFVELHGATLIARTVAVLRECFATNLIIANRPAAFAHLGLPVFADEIPGCGPLGGLHVALRHAQTDTVFVVSCDMPFLSPALIRDIVAQAGDFDAVAPFVDGRYEPLHALYRTRILPEVERRLAARQLTMQALLASVRTKAVTEIDRRTLMNVNTPEALAEARHL